MKVSSLYAILLLVLAAGQATIPEFEPFNTSLLAKDSFFEQFTYKTLKESQWHPSSAKKDNQFSYVGKWAIEPSYKYPGYQNDNGLVLKTRSAHHAISYKLEQPFDNTNNDLVLQYEIKTQKGQSCGGAYIKLLNQDFDKSGEFNDKTPFQLMFGPDRCGTNDKVHFIITRINPITGISEEKHLSQPPMSNNSPLSTLYTLVFKKNSDFEIRINGGVVKSGNLLEKPHLLKPRLNPPKEIIDELDIKPNDWEEMEYILDESIEKPHDYDEKYGSIYIPDPNIIKPQGWLDDEPLYILDPFAEKPQEWNDEEDGEWEVPIIKNPKCDYGCGKWEAPLIPNPNYKGIWVHPVIKNPNYKGEWQPKVIPNPNYYEDNHPSNLDLIGGIGFELWSIEEDILFDNIYLGHSLKEAEFIGNKTFLPKLQLETSTYELDKPKPINQPSPPPQEFDQLFNESESEEFLLLQVYTFFKLVFKREFLNIKDFWYEFNRTPVETLMKDPLKALVYSGVFIFCFTFIFGIINVVMFLCSSWIQQSKDAIKKGAQDAREQQQEDPQPNGAIPKIVELDERNNVKSSSAQAQTTQTSLTSLTTTNRKRK